MGAKSRTKGAVFEREVAAALRPLFPQVERMQEAFIGKGVDLMNTGSLVIQCKRYAGPVPMTKLWDIPAREDQIAVLAAKSDRKPATVTLRLEDFLQILGDVMVVY